MQNHSIYVKTREVNHTLTLSTPVAMGGKEPGDYEGLYNKPSINGVELSGNLSLADLGIPDLSNVPTAPLSTKDLDEITSP